MSDRRREADSTTLLPEDWTDQARLAAWDWNSEQETPVVEAYLPPRRGEPDLSTLVARATKGKSRPGPGARVEIQDGQVLLFRHDRDTSPKRLAEGDAGVVNFTKPARHPVGIKVASVIRVGPNGEIVTA